MRRVNLKNPETKPDPGDPPGYRAEMFRFGGDLGARHTGASLYVIAPGEGGSPYHYELGEEEWVLGAHEIRNDSDAPVRILMWSTVVVPTATTYPDSDKVGIWTGNPADDLIVPRSAGVDPWAGHPGA
jgi:uncharacterized cupin superfamily protein